MLIPPFLIRPQKDISLVRGGWWIEPSACTDVDNLERLEES